MFGVPTPFSTVETAGGGERIWGDYRLLSILPYLAFQPLFRQFCQRSGIYLRCKDAVWKPLMAVYNLLLSFFSFAVFILICHCLDSSIPTATIWDVGHFEKPATNSGSALDDRILDVFAPFVGRAPSLYNMLAYFFYLSKYVEYFDTYFLILCDRPVSWLQLYHHVGAPIDMALLYWSKSDAIWVSNSCFIYFPSSGKMISIVATGFGM
jgi:hypothetical protein